MNTTGKGLRVERQAMKVCEAIGYRIHRTHRSIARTKHGPRSNVNDLFGCIDLVGKKPGHPTRWLQVTSQASVAAKIRELEDIPWDDVFDDVEIWQLKPAEGGEPAYFQVYKRREGYEYRFLNRLPASI